MCFFRNFHGEQQLCEDDYVTLSLREREGENEGKKGSSKAFFFLMFFDALIVEKKGRNMGEKKIREAKNRLERRRKKHNEIEDIEYKYSSMKNNYFHFHWKL